ncbi:MAG: arginine--tRNA ligase, partial [Lachnospiraceae bacterium]|nr:arginine--tRNA ligase [Lachnospiraceae bacterium]
FKAIELMGYHWHADCVHIPYGLVSMDGAKLSSRNGNVIYAEDILKEATGRALEAIEEKNPDLTHKEEVARQVGIGAVIFHDLYNQRIKNVDFSWEDVLSFEGTTGPYVQYTYARAKSILRKNGIHNPPTAVDYRCLEDDITFALVKTLMGYEETVCNAAQKYEPSILAKYLVTLSAAFNRFYHECPILNAAFAERNARIILVDTVQKVLKDGCCLLGMECPEEM